MWKGSNCICKGGCKLCTIRRRTALDLYSDKQVNSFTAGKQQWCLPEFWSSVQRRLFFQPTICKNTGPVPSLSSLVPVVTHVFTKCFDLIVLYSVRTRDWRCSNKTYIQKKLLQSECKVALSCFF